MGLHKCSDLWLWTGFVASARPVLPAQYATPVCPQHGAGLVVHLQMGLHGPNCTQTWVLETNSLGAKHKQRARVEELSTHSSEGVRQRLLRCE